MKPLLIVGLAAVLSITANAAEKETKSADPKAHDGIWKPIAAVLGGARLPDDSLKAITLKITGSTYEVTATARRNQIGAPARSTRARVPSA
jgi:hypothetical protein